MKKLWPWALTLPPLAAVAGGVVMVILAVRTPNALVVADYAHIEDLTSERFALDREAARLGLYASLQFSEDRIDVRLGSTSGQVLPDELVLHLQHATDPLRDRELHLVRAGIAYRVESGLAPGRYRLELMPPDGNWRLASRFVRPVGEVVLQPQQPGG